MPQHDECNCEYEDFTPETLIQSCPGCAALDGRTCLGVSHKRRSPAGKFHVSSVL